MAIDLGTLYYTINARTQPLNRAYQQVKTFGNKARSTFAGITGAITSLQGSIAILAGGAGLGMLAKSFVDVASKAEQAQVALDSITGGRGEQTFKRLNQWALEMPLNTEKAIDSFKQLRAMGVQPTIKDMTTLADTASALGGGAQTFQGISRALGQIATKGKVSAEELMQLAERGVPAYEILQKQLGLTGEQVRNIGESGISANRALQALMQGLEQRFGGTSKKMMNTWAGRMESLRSWAKEFARFVMKSGPFQAMKDSLGSFLEYLDSKKGQMALKQWASETAMGVLNAFEVMVNSVRPFMETLRYLNRTIKGVAWAAQYLKFVFTASLDSINELGLWLTNQFHSYINTIIGWLNKIPFVSISAIEKVKKGGIGKWFEREAEESALAMSRLSKQLNKLAKEDPVPKSWEKNFNKLRSIISNARKATDRFTNSSNEAGNAGRKLGTGIGKANEEMKDAEQALKDISDNLNKVGEDAERAGMKGKQGMNLLSDSAKESYRQLQNLGKEASKLSNQDFSMNFGAASRSGKSELDGKGFGGVPLGAPLPTTEREAREWYGGAFANDGNQAKVSTASTQSTDNMMPSIEINMSNNGLQDPQDIAGQIEDELIRRMRSGRLRQAIQDAAKGRA